MHLNKALQTYLVCVAWCGIGRQELKFLPCKVASGPGSQLAVLCGKNFYSGYYTQIVEPKLFIPPMLVGTIDFYHFILLSLTLTLHGDHKVSAKLLNSFSPTLFFIWWRWNLMWWWISSSWIPWDYFWWKCMGTKKIAAVLQTASKKFNIGMHSDVYKWTWFKLCMMVDALVL